MTRLETLGTVGIEGDPFRQHQPILLLTYLAHEGPKDRHHLASLFWPDAKNPRNNLSSALTRIRQRDGGALIADGRRLATSATTDAQRVLQAIEDGRGHDAVRAYKGRFLDGYELRGIGVELEEWIFRTRQVIAGAVSLQAVALSRRLEAEGRAAAAADLAEAAIDISLDGPPLTEDLPFLHRVLVRESRVKALTIRAEAVAFGVELERSTGRDARPDGSATFRPRRHRRRRGHCHQQG